MNKTTPKFLIRRILVALDDSPHSQSALEAAANLAARLDAELIGVFVEDVNLLRLAQLPFAQEVRQSTATVEKLELHNLRRQLRLQAAQAQKNLERIARRLSLHCTFRVAHGPVSAEVLAAALEADLLALGRVSHARHSRLGSTAKTAVSQTTRTVLLMRPGHFFNQPVLVVYDGTSGSEQALAVAAYLAKGDGRLQILLWADTPQQATQYEQNVRQTLQNKELRLQFRQLTQTDSANLAYAIKLSGMGLMVLSDVGSRLPAATIQTLLEELDHPILLVR